MPNLVCIDSAGIVILQKLGKWGCWWWSVWPDWAIFCTFVNHSKPLAAIILPKSPTLLGNFCKGVKIIHFSSEIIFGQLLWTFGDFYLVTLMMIVVAHKIENNLRLFLCLSMTKPKEQRRRNMNDFVLLERNLRWGILFPFCSSHFIVQKRERKRDWERGKDWEREKERERERKRKRERKEIFAVICN